MAKILIDHNIKPAVFNILRRYGHEAESAGYNNWESLQNGELVKAAADAGFEVILTQDTTFEVDGADGWRMYPSVAIILIDTDALPQKGAAPYLQRFEDALRAESFNISKGDSNKWPKNYYG